MSIFSRVFITCILPLIIVFGGITAGVSVFVGNLVRDFSEEQAKTFANEITMQIDNEFQRAKKLLKILVEHFENEVEYSEPNSSEVISDFLKTVTRMNPNFLSVWISFEPGIVRKNERFSVDMLRNGGSIIELLDFNEENLLCPEESPWYYFPFMTQEIWFETADLYDYEQGDGEQFTASISAPIFKNGAVIGIVGVDLLHNSIFSFIDNKQEKDKIKMMILTEKGDIVYAVDNELVKQSILDRFYGKRTSIEKHLANGGGSKVIQKISPFMGVASIKYFIPIINNMERDKFSHQLFLYVEKPKYELFAEARKISFIISIMGIAGFILLTVMLYFAMKRVLKPVKDITKTATEIAEGNLDIDFSEVLEDEEKRTTKLSKVPPKNEITVLLISLRKMIEQLKITSSLKLKAEFLENASRAKSEFLAKMSHEIRTPMTAISGMSEMALREELSPNVRRQINTIKRSSASLLSVINDILDFSKIESGKMEIVPVDYSFSSMINDVVNITQTNIAETGLKLVTEVNEKIPNGLYGDEIRIRQILLNLLSNAVKYTEKGTITFIIDSKLTEENELILIVDVVDTGKGIKTEDINKLFGDFVQLDMIENKGVTGTGLGLAITKNLVEAMDGEIRVSSTYGEGSRFSVIIPQKIKDFTPISKLIFNSDNHLLEINEFDFTAPEAKVLVVDDIDTNIMVARGLLNFFGIQIDSCLNGNAAIEKIKENDYDLVFMDHMMPVMDGIETTKYIRVFKKDLPIIALTANAIQGMKEMFLENEFSDFLSKPIEIKKLEKVLKQWLPKEKQIKLKEEDRINIKIEKTDLAIDGINVNTGLCRTGGSVKNYLQTLEIFYSDGVRILPQIKESLASGNISLYATLIHALKSAAANIGANDLSEQAGFLEKAANDLEITFLKAQSNVFFENLKAVLCRVKKVLPETDNKKISPEVLQSLKTALADYDLKKINELSETLQGFSSAKSIVEKILCGDYDEAAEEIDKLIL